MSLGFIPMAMYRMVIGNVKLSGVPSHRIIVVTPHFSLKTGLNTRPNNSFGILNFEDSPPNELSRVRSPM